MEWGYGMRIFFVLSMVIALAACQSAATVRQAEGNDTFLNLHGSVVQLRQPLQIQAERARVFIQHGKAVVGYDINEYAPQCNFEVDSIDHQGLTIEPETFRVARVQYLREEVALAQPLQVASLRLAGIWDRGSTMVFAGYHFWFDSPKQVGVMRMTCRGVYAEPYEVEPPTLEQIHQTLGEVAQLRQR